MYNIDLERINRENFRSLVYALSYPGDKKPLKPIFNSSMLAISSLLLYSEVSYFYDGKEDMEIIKSITNAKRVDPKEADYIFCDEVKLDLLEAGKIGTFKDPDFSCTVVFKCHSFDGIKVRLSGVGIEKEKYVTLPVTGEFIDIFRSKNRDFPLGLEVFFLNDNNEVMALSRTTKVEII